MDYQDSSESDLEAQILRPNESKYRHWMLDDNDLDEKLPLDNGWHKTNPTADLGNLDRLPPELLTNILLQIDLQSLTDFRRVNQRAMQVVDSISQYDVIINHAPGSLRAILAVQKGGQVTCQDLYDKLCMSKCESCGHFGCFLYLISFRRACLFCFEYSPYCYPTYPGNARKQFSLKRTQLRSSAQIVSLPGCYSPGIHNYRRRRRLHDFMSLSSLKLDTHRLDEAQILLIQSRIQAIESAWKRQVSNNPSPSAVWFRGISSEHKESFERIPERYMATIRFPRLDKYSKTSEWGFLCKKCSDDLSEAWKHAGSIDYGCMARASRLYDRATFREHRKTCRYNEPNKCDESSKEPD